MDDRFSGHHLFRIYDRESIDKEILQNPSYLQRKRDATGPTNKF